MQRQRKQRGPRGPKAYLNTLAIQRELGATFLSELTLQEFLGIPLVEARLVPARRGDATKRRDVALMGAGLWRERVDQIARSGPERDAMRRVRASTAVDG